MKKNKTTLFSIFILIVMVGSIFLYSMNLNDETKLLNEIQVGNYTFYETPDGYFGIILKTNTNQQIPILFRLDPRFADNIFLDEQAMQLIKSARKIYFIYDPNQENITQIGPKLKVAMGQLSRIIPLVRPNIIPVVAQTADIPNNTADDEIPIRTCANATDEVSVILFEIGTANQIIVDDKCIIIQGVNPDGLINASDKLGMNLINIMI